MDRTLAEAELEAGRNRRVAAEALFEAMGSEQFDLEAVDRFPLGSRYYVELPLTHVVGEVGDTPETAPGVAQNRTTR